MLVLTKPEEATSAMLMLFSFAMKPRTGNMTKPERKLVTVLTVT